MLSVVAVLVSGCGSSGETPGALPARSTVPSPSAAASASATPAPSASLTPEARIEASIRTYFALFDAAAATGDVEALKDASVPECSCRDVIANIADAYRAGQSFQGYTTTISSIADVRLDPKFSDAQVTYTTSAYELVDRDGRTVQHFDAEESVVSAIVDDGRGFRILKLEDALS